MPNTKTPDTAFLKSTYETNIKANSWSDNHCSVRAFNSNWSLSNHPYAFVDFPCFDEEFLQREIKSDTRIAYCISVWPLEALSGGGIYEYGSTSQDEVTARELELRRDGQTLLVNAHPLATGETYETTKWKMSFNPWILFTRRFEINNKGLITSTESVETVDALYVSGDVYEGWFLNPLGLIILGSGIWLFKQGKKELNLESNA